MYLVGALITALAPTFVIMVIGRFVYGIGIGLVRFLFYNPPSFPLQVFVRVLSSSDWCIQFFLDHFS